MAQVAGIARRYMALVGLIALLLWFVVPKALHQVEAAVGHLPMSRADVARAAKHSSGLRREILLGLQKRLQHLPPPTSLIHPAVTATKKALEVLIAIFFVLASAAYWIFERD